MCGISGKFPVLRSAGKEDDHLTPLHTPHFSSYFEVKQMSKCSICLDTLNGDQLLKICPTDVREICLDCYVQYVQLLLKDSIPGTCPLLICPLCKSASCLISPDFLKLLPHDITELYLLRTKSLLSLQCGTCHKRSSLFLENLNDDCLLQERLQSTYELFLLDITKYECGVLSISDFYTLLTRNYFQEIARDDSESSWPVMKAILSKLGNPERKANLHLRYLRKRPFISTLCCSRLQCFHCRTADAHPGRTCDEISSSRPISDMIKCPTCNIHIVKGDGCDSVSCVCGTKFSFTSELKKFNQSALFQESYPIDTEYHCIAILCGGSSDINVPLAKSWYDYHEAECQPSFLRFWCQKYPQCPTQSALVINSSVQGQFFERAKNMWIHHHQSEYEVLKFNLEYAQLSLWDSLYPSISHKRECVTKRNEGIWDPMQTALTKSQRETINSVMNIFSAYDQNYGNYLNEKLKSSSLQFLLLFGHVTLGLREIPPTCPDGIFLGMNLENVDMPVSNESSPFGGHLILGTGYIVSSLLARHNGSYGVILSCHEEDNTYDVNWFSCNQTERIHRNYLRLKGRGKRYAPYCHQNSEQLQTFKRFLKYLHILSSQKSSILIDCENHMIESWKVKCEQRGIMASAELNNLEKIVDEFSNLENMEFLLKIQELLPAHYPLHLLSWRDLYSAILYRNSLKI